MPSWNQLLEQFIATPPEQKAEWLAARLNEALTDLRPARDGRNVLLYGSAFLQKPQAPAQLIQITHEDLNGFMSVIHGMDWNKGLTLILHTPGGVTNAAETIVQYLRSKFASVETIVPAFAMSAGTMISLSTERVVMGRQSQLGPIDPQMPFMGRFVSARAVVEQYERAKGEILKDRNAAHVWAPILSSLGPALLLEAQNALDYGELMVGRWLAQYMFDGDGNPAAMGQQVAKHFNDATTHKSHGRRIDRDEARRNGVIIEELEARQGLQEVVLTIYHLMTILFEQSPMTKLLWSSTGASWIKNWETPPAP